MNRFTDGKIVDRSDDKLRDQVMTWWGYHFGSRHGTIISVYNLDNGGVIIETNYPNGENYDDGFFTQEIVKSVVDARIKTIYIKEYDR